MCLCIEDMYMVYILSTYLTVRYGKVEREASSSFAVCIITHILPYMYICMFTYDIYDIHDTYIMNIPGCLPQ